MEESEKRWKLSDLGRGLRESLLAIVKGDFLLRLDIGRYFLHILYIFLCFGVAIWVSLMIDTTLTKVERNRAAIEELEVQHNQKEYDLMCLERRSAVSEMLNRMGSEVGEPQEPVTVIVK